MDSKEIIDSLSEWMEKNSVTVSIDKLGTFPYFPGEKESRNVYNVTLTNGKTGKQFAYHFGDSIVNSFYTVRDVNKFEQFTSYEDALSYARRRGLKLSSVSKPSTPTPIDVLYCAYEPCENFDDFCANFGYDTDSRKALETYLDIDKQNAGIVSVLGQRLALELREITSEY